MKSAGDSSKSVFSRDGWRYNAYSPSKLNSLAVVIKLTERCNINCTYCHVFNGRDDTWRNHPKHLSISTCQEIGKFLAQGFEALPNLTRCRLVLFGGEPLLLGKRAFDTAVSCLRRSMASVVTEIVCTTNGILVDSEWIDIFAKHDIAVGVSLDGPPFIHDRRRIDHRGRGTYEQVVGGLRVLQKAAEAGRIVEPSVLAVIDPLADPRQIYRHFVDTLNIRSMSFLSPKSSYDSFDEVNAGLFGPWLSALFDEWTSDNNPNISVNNLRGYLAAFLRKKAFTDFGDNERREWESVITIASDGSLGPDDDFRAIPLWDSFPQLNVDNTNLLDFLDSEVFHILNRAKREVTSECSKCSWRPVCGGGSLINRYSVANGFDNPSALCSGHKLFFSDLLAYLVRNGVHRDQIEYLMPIS